MSSNGESRTSYSARAEGTRARRTQAQRDAATVEIGYALASAVFVAAVAFGAVSGPALFLDLSHGAERALVTAGAGLAAVLFALRVATVLFRFHNHAEPQPSQPGLTNPDS
ncbi:DUF6332 family protein [Streptomyces sp. NPDC005141]